MKKETKPLMLCAIIILFVMVELIGPKISNIILNPLQVALSVCGLLLSFKSGNNRILFIILFAVALLYAVVGWVVSLLIIN